PARPHPMHLGVMFESLRIILLRFERERIEEDVTTDLVAKQSLDLHQVRRDAGTNSLALGIHHGDRDGLVFDQVLVEPDLFPFMRGQDDIGEISPPDLLARRLLPPFSFPVERALVSFLPDPARLGGAGKRSKRRKRDQTSSHYPRHSSSPLQNCQRKPLPSREGMNLAPREPSAAITTRHKNRL